MKYTSLVMIDRIKDAKYASSILSPEKIKEYTEKIEKGFVEDKWYLEPKLNLKSLAIKSNIPAHYISQIINQQFGKNFFDYVNCYRIEYLKKKLLDPTEIYIKIEGLAYMSGFNSKAAFQRAFKKHVGISPKEYRRKYEK